MKRSIKKWQWRRREKTLMGSAPNPGLEVRFGGEALELDPGASVSWYATTPNRWDDWKAARDKRRHARLWAPRSPRWEGPLPSRLQRPMRATPPERRAKSYEVSGSLTLEPGAWENLCAILGGGVPTK